MSLVTLAEVHRSLQPLVWPTIMAAKTVGRSGARATGRETAQPEHGEEAARRAGSLGPSLWLPWALWIHITPVPHLDRTHNEGQGTGRVL